MAELAVPHATTLKLEDVALFHGAGADFFEAFRGRCAATQYEPGEMILDFDEMSDGVFFVVTGSVRVMIRTAGGREIILGDLHTGQFFGEMAAIDAQPRSASVTALNRSKVVRVGGATFMEMVVASPEITRRLLRVLTQRIRTGNSRLVEHSSMTARLRLYAELLRTARPRGPGGPLIISPPPVQSVLASRIGGHREVVSREMAALSRAGVLERTPTALILHDPEALKRAIDEQVQD